MTPANTHTRLIQRFSLLPMEPMKKHTSFRVGGPADLMALPRTGRELRDLIQSARQHRLPITIIGGGSNILVPDRGIRGLVIVLKNLRSSIQLKGNTLLEASAGEPLARIVSSAVDQGLSGLEFAAGIPGTLGGAVMMNAGTADRWISHVLDSVDVLDLNTLELKILKKEEMDFSYRNLSLPDKVILSVRLKLEPGDPELIRDRFEKNLKAKKKTQPVSLASGGCFFKNPGPDQSAGKLIDQAGLKGMRVNDAQVSDCHANFIINRGNASCKDILALEKIIREKVWEKFNIRLETEVKVVDDGKKE
ncbi:UDP-N-acetylmuramate dehydrogenase [Desulfospira joergensenii]|uniref:UDP-N-acetylmuramate dehydrogenase n=1 Tax=Desulfospira joergensenii TaxID=53329 RepID=UPI0003B370ED|nr:UDP-N-acetylmuramate dehydrogenase [Desulfospira joergensenii]